MYRRGPGHTGVKSRSFSFFEPSSRRPNHSPIMTRALSILLLALGLLTVSATAADHPTLPHGSQLPDFKLPGIDGRDYTPADFKAADVLVVVFTSNHCPTAQLYEPRLKQLVADFAGQSVAFLAIQPNNTDAVRLDEMAWTDVDDSFEAMKERAKDRSFNFPYVDDGPTQATTEKFGAVATPHAFVFDRDRKLRFEGRIDDSERPDLVKEQTTRLAIEALLAGKEPPVTKTKVFGCSIKWKDKAADNQRWLAKVAREPVTLTHADADALKELRANQGTGKIRFINVWATWCGPCVSEFDELVDQNLRFRMREVEFVTLAAQFPDEEAKVLKFLQDHKASTRNLIFGSTDKYALMEALDPEWNGALPHTLLIDPQGKVIYRQTGSLDFLAMRRALLPALDAISPWPATGK